MDIKNTTYPQNLIDEFSKYFDEDIEINCNNADIKNGISAAIAMLSEQDQLALTMRYRYLYTFEEIGNHFGITRERARQIIIRATRNLVVRPRRFLIMQGLEGYINSQAELRANTLTRIRLREEYDKGYANGFAVAKGEDEVVEVSHEPVKVSDMQLSVSTTNCLIRANYTTLVDVLNADKESILRIRNLGNKKAGEVAHKLKELGFPESAWGEFISYWTQEKTPVDTNLSLENFIDFDVDEEDN